MIRILLLLLLSLVASGAAATAQEGDVLRFDGGDHALFTNPLSAWLAANPDRMPRGDVQSSSNWRGYVATWEVDDNTLRLVDVTVRDSDPDREHGTVLRNVLAQLFPGRDAVVADWYTGTLVVPQGDLVEYVHMGYGSTYARYTLFRIVAGRVAERRDLDYVEFDEYRRQKFAAWRMTPEFARIRSELTDGDNEWSVEDAERFMVEFYAESFLSHDVPGATPAKP